MTGWEQFLQQLVIGLTNGSIIALIALGYTMVYGIIELINFAHGDVFMLGAFFLLTLLAAFGWTDPARLTGLQSFLIVLGLLIVVPVFTAGVNWSIDRIGYKPIRRAPKLAPLVSAIGISFILQNVGFLWGGLPLDVFAGGGPQAGAPKSVPLLVPKHNILTAWFGLDTRLSFTVADLLVVLVTVPLLVGLTLFVQYTKLGKAMRATAQNPVAAQLMGIDINRVIGATFLIGGALGGFASVIYAFYNNTIVFNMGFRAGMDAFTAAVLGGIGNLPGAALGGLLIGVVRSMSDQYLAAQWSNAVVFAILVLVLIFRPTGILGAKLREKV